MSRLVIFVCISLGACGDAHEPDQRLYEGLQIETHNGTKGYIHLVKCTPFGCSYHVTWEPSMERRPYDAGVLINMIKGV